MNVTGFLAEAARIEVSEIVAGADAGRAPAVSG